MHVVLSLISIGFIGFTHLNSAEAQAIATTKKPDCIHLTCTQKPSLDPRTVDKSLLKIKAALTCETVTQSPQPPPPAAMWDLAGSSTVELIESEQGTSVSEPLEPKTSGRFFTDKDRKDTLQLQFQSEQGDISVVIIKDGEGALLTGIDPKGFDIRKKITSLEVENFQPLDCKTTFNPNPNSP